MPMRHSGVCVCVCSEFHIPGLAVLSRENSFRIRSSVDEPCCTHKQKLEKS